MKRRLFWKILVGFWLTFFATTQGIWLLFVLTRGEWRPPDHMTAEQVAPFALAAGAAALERGGPAAFDTFVAGLTGPARDRLERAAPDAPAAPRTDDRTALFSRSAAAPDGTHHRIDYRYEPPTPPPGLFNTPPEVLGMGLLGALLFATTLAWYLTEPIHRLRTGFDRLARGAFDTRLTASIGRRRDEIADLARDFDHMAAHLERLVTARDRLLHDVSHELRSPLARLRLATGLARQDPDQIAASLDRIDRESARLDALVDELLTLARAEHDGSGGDEYFDLAGVVASVVEDARFEAEAAAVHIHVATDLPDDEDDRPSVRGDAELVRRAVDNVVRNALRFSQRDETVDVDVAFDANAGRYRIVAADRGPGTAGMDPAALFKPFVRGEHAGAGFGLGLAIAQRAAVAHGGDIRACSRAGGGLEVHLCLPCTAGPPGA